MGHRASSRQLALGEKMLKQLASPPGNERGMLKDGDESFDYVVGVRAGLSKERV